MIYLGMDLKHYSIKRYKMVKYKNIIVRLCTKGRL